MSNATDANENTYNISAQRKHEEAEGYARDAIKIRIIMIVAVVLLSALDLMLFYEPITAVNYDTNEIWNAALCVVCAVLPILSAVVAAHFFRLAKYGEEGKGAKYTVFAWVAVALTAAVLAVGWMVRADYYGEDAGWVALLFNVVAVIAAVGAFFLDYHYAYKLTLSEARKNEAEAERDVLQLMNCQAQFLSMDESDEDRRRVDNAAYYRQCSGVVIAGLDAKDRARKELARRVAKNADARKHIMGTPFQVGPEQIIADTNEEIFLRTYASAGAPSPSKIAGDWPSIDDKQFIIEEQIKNLDEHDACLKRLQNMGTSSNDDKPITTRGAQNSNSSSGGGSGSGENDDYDENDEPILVHAESV